MLRVCSRLFYSAFALVALAGWSLLSHQDCLVMADERLPSSAVRDRIAFCTDSESFVGPEACITCHQAEYKVWAESAHANNAYDLLRTSSNAKHYARKLGIDENLVTSDARCVSCHSTPQSTRERRTGLLHGVTCESCHNAAGGDNGWLNSHATYGLGVSRREDESAEHRQFRIQRSEAAGQYRSSDFYSLAKQCYECHVIGDEQLVVVGGHHPGNLGFEMTSWFDKGVRHNLCLNPHRNRLAPSLETDPLWRTDSASEREVNHRRVMYVVSLLVDLEVSLRNRGKAESPSFSRAAATRIAAAQSRLATIADEQSARVLVAADDAVADLQDILFMPPNGKDRESFLDAAELVAETAQKVSQAGDGAQFSVADQFLKLPPR